MSELRVVGKRIKRPDSRAKVTGVAKYTADTFPNRKDVLVGKALFSSFGHALIKSIDTSAAEAVEGVEIVMTAKDLPAGNRYGGMTHDKPVLAETKVIYEGDAVAILAAKDLKTAEYAISLIRVEYEPLEAYDDPRETIKPDAPRIHDTHPISKDTNISDTHIIKKGNVEEAFQKADIVIDNHYETPMLDHAYLEPDVCLAEPDPINGGITLYSPQHAVQLARKALCGVFGMPQSKIRVISAIVGGGFGGKEDSTFDVSAIAGVLAIKTQKPVMFELTRDEVFKNTGKRHACFIHHRLAADKHGNLLGIDVKTIIDKGAYKSIDAIPNRTAMYAGGPYNIPAAYTESHSVFTNHPYGCAYRGLGSPQAHFAMECQVEELAKAVGADSLEIRQRNMLKDGDTTIFGQVAMEERGLGLGECIVKLKAAMDWEQPLDNSHPTLKRGRGVGCFMYGIGTGSVTDGAHCFVQAQPDGSINVALSQNELGQGLLVAMAQIAAETMGVSLEKVSVDISDSMATPESGATVASRTTVLIGNAVMAGCNILKERFLRFIGPHMGSDARNMDIDDDKVFIKGKPQTAVSFASVVARAFAAQVPLATVGSWYPPMVYMDANSQGDRMHTYSYGAHGVEVEVDIETGVVSVTRSVIAIDLGKAINPDTVEGQIQGGVAQAIGWSIMEEEFMKNGRMTNHSYHDFLIPTTMDLPKLECIIVEHPNSLGPYGAKGIGEPPLVGAAPAIRNAVWNATGVKINAIPMTPVRVMEALEQAGKL